MWIFLLSLRLLQALDYSDDEKEHEAKRKIRNNKKKENGCAGTPTNITLSYDVRETYLLFFHFDSFGVVIHLPFIYFHKIRSFIKNKIFLSCVLQF